MNNTEKWEGTPTEAQKSYWNSLKKKEGEEAPRWKGEKAGKSAFHQYINKHHGRPKICENKECKGKSKDYDWCIKTGRKYSHNIEDYLRMCRSCHRRYDLTPEKKEQAIKNLHWNTRKTRISKYGKKFNEYQSTVGNKV